MVVTNTSTGWGTAITGVSTGMFGISPTFSKTKEMVPNYDNVPRIHKDKNGCIKTSYWATQPIQVGDYGFAGISDLATFNSSSGGSFTMSETDASATTAATTNASVYLRY